MSTPQVYSLWRQKNDSVVISDKTPLAEEEALFVTEIAEPELIVFPADSKKHTGAAVIICPGGGYSGLALSSEGYDCAAWLAEQGITGMVLTYRRPFGDSRIPLEDIQAALKFARKHSQAFGLRPKAIGVAGFSAGGHLAAQACTLFTPDTRPDFALLYYPVISLDADIGGMTRINLLGQSPTHEDVERYSCHRQVSADTPPTLIMASDDDSIVPPIHSLMYYAALKDNSVPASLHLFPQGDHAWGFKGFNSFLSGIHFEYIEEMKLLTAKWLRVAAG